MVAFNFSFYLPFYVSFCHIDHMKKLVFLTYTTNYKKKKHWWCLYVPKQHYCMLIIWLTKVIINLIDRIIIHAFINHEFIFICPNLTQLKLLDVDPMTYPVIFFLYYHESNCFNFSYLSPSFISHKQELSS